MDTGEEVKNVIEVDCNAGWLRKYETSIRGDNCVERVEGNWVKVKEGRVMVAGNGTGVGRIRK